MRSTFAGVAAFAATALAHYNFEALIVNDNVTGAYEYVRRTTNSNSPVTDVTSKDFVCNQGGLDAAIMAKTSTHAVAPGDHVGFTINAALSHPGPLQVYMSRAPDGTKAQDYDGSGAWFKAYELSTSAITSAGLQWATYPPSSSGITNFTFALPPALPAGEYLMRAEHVALHGASVKGGAQYYVGCAQLSVTGSGAGTPAPTVSIPGVYSGTEPGLVINLYYPAPTSYAVPGPATWPNACDDHTANLAGQASDGDCTGGGSSSSNGTGGAAASSVSASSSVASTAAAASSSPVATGKASTTGAGGAGGATTSALLTASAVNAAKPDKTRSSTAPAATATGSGSGSSSPPGKSCSSKKRRASKKLARRA